MLFVPASYLTDRATLSYGRLGFPGPLRLVAAAHVPGLWLVMTLGRERLRRWILFRVGGPVGLALAALLPALYGALLSTSRVGPALSPRRLEAFIADIGLSLGAASLLVLSRSVVVSGAHSAGTTYLRTFALSDAEGPPFQSLAHFYTSVAWPYHVEVACACVPSFAIAWLAVRSRRYTDPLRHATA